MIGLVEATRKGDGRTHVVAGIDRIHVHSQGVASDVAWKDASGKGPFESEKGGPMRTSGTEGRPADGKPEVGNHLFKGCSRGLFPEWEWTAFCKRSERYWVTISGTISPSLGTVPSSLPRTFGLVPDLKFDDRFGLFKDQDMIAFPDEGLHHLGGKRVGGSDLKDRDIFLQDPAQEGYPGPWHDQIPPAMIPSAALVPVMVNKIERS